MKQKTRGCFVRRLQRTLGFRELFQAIGRALGCARKNGPHLALTCSSVLFLLLMLPGLADAQRIQTASTASAHVVQPGGGARVEALLDKLPLFFEANKGQFDARVKFLARAPKRNVFITGEGMVLVFLTGDRDKPIRTVVRLEFEDATSTAEFVGLDRLDAITNYFDERRITDVPSFARIRQLDVYPGIDVVYYGNQDRLEHDFIILPGADPGLINFRLTGHDAAKVSENGDLLIETKAGALRLHKPFAYQDREGRRIEVPARYVLAGGRLRFEVGDYDRSLPLVIDPILSYSTLLGGGATDTAEAVAVDASGNIYITGTTFSTNFPLAGAYQTSLAGSSSVFVSKLNAGGTALIYSTYIGGKKGESQGMGIAIDGNGNAFVTGRTSSAAFPVTSGAWSTQNTSGSFAGFVTKLSPQGNSLVYSTYVPPGEGAAIALDASGNAHLALGRKVGIFSGGVVKVNSTGTAPVYVMNFPGSTAARGIAVDGAGNAYVTGVTTSPSFPVVNPYQASLNGTQDAFVTKINPAGGLVYSTYLGGSLRDAGNAVAVDGLGNAHVVGTTYSSNFPTVSPVQSQKGYTGSGHESINNAFVTKLDASGSSLLFSSYLGGQSCLGDGVFSCSPNGDDDGALAVAVDAAGNIYLAGYARSRVFPQTDPIQPLVPKTSQYAETVPFVGKITFTLFSNSEYVVTLGKKGSSFTDGAARGVAVDAMGNAYVAGNIANQFPTTPGAFQASAVANPEAFAFKVSPGQYRTIRVGATPTAPTSADSIVLTAYITSAVPNGTVTFKNSGNVIGAVPLSGGLATLPLNLPAGVHEITVAYSGDNKISRPMFLPVRQAPICN